MLRAALLLPGCLLVAACGSGSATPAAAGGPAVAAGDTSCVVSGKAVQAGRNSFAVKNVGSDVTEVYVYGKASSGQFDRVVGEVENVGPGTSRTLTADLEHGDYRVVCKPGMKGKGVSATVTVIGRASAARTAVGRTVVVSVTDTGYQGLEHFAAKVGETIALTLTNASASREHELEVKRPDGSSLGEVGPTPPGKDGAVVLTFDKAGTWSYDSGIADDAGKGLKGSFTVS